MSKVKLIVLQGAICLMFLIGYYLIGDIKTSLGVLMVVWANNINTNRSTIHILLKGKQKPNNPSEGKRNG